jgi:hypothetical protein
MKAPKSSSSPRPGSHRRDTRKRIAVGLCLFYAIRRTVGASWIAAVTRCVMGIVVKGEEHEEK